jgi:hypothetical protein
VSCEGHTLMHSVLYESQPLQLILGPAGGRLRSASAVAGEIETSSLAAGEASEETSRMATGGPEEASPAAGEGASEAGQSRAPHTLPQKPLP